MFWKIFCDLCNQHQTTPNAVCARLGFSVATSTKWKKGAIPRDTTLLKVAEYFNVSVKYLLGIKEEEEETKEGNALRVKVYGEIAAGIPIEAIEDVIDFEEVPKDWGLKGEYIALKIKGDSMSPRICDGDVVIIRLQDDVENGEIAAVYVGQDCFATCKRIKKSADGISLLSYNPAFPPMFYTFPEVRDLPVRILGKVVELRAKF